MDLGDLLRDNHSFVHAELVLPQVQVGEQGEALAHARDEGQCGQVHTSSHKEDQIFVSGLTECRHL